jgi:hypothetical protein
LPEHQLDDQKPSDEPPALCQQVISTVFVDVAGTMCEANQPGPKDGHQADDHQSNTRCEEFEFVDPGGNLRHGRLLYGLP